MEAEQQRNGGENHGVRIRSDLNGGGASGSPRARVEHSARPSSGRRSGDQSDTPAHDCVRQLKGSRQKVQGKSRQRVEQILQGGKVRTPQQSWREHTNRPCSLN